MNGGKINVAMYCPFLLPYYGGAELATLNLAKNLKNLCNVKLYSFNCTPDLNLNTKFQLRLSSGFPGQEIVSGVNVLRYSVVNLPIIKNFSAKLIEDVRSSDADILHFQGVSRVFSRLLLEIAAKKKVNVLTTHGLQESTELISQSRFGILSNTLFARSLKRLDHAIALSSTDAKLLANLGLRKDRTTLIPNGIDITKFEKRRDFVEKDEKLKILCVARFAENKNYEVLVEALSKLREKIKFKAYFVGSVTDIRYFKRILNLIKKNKLENFISVEPSLDDPALIDCYLSCDLFVLPSNSETFGLVVLEAMYAGLPVVATCVGYVPEIIRNGINGFVVQKNDSDALCHRCLQLLMDEKMRKEMGAVNKEVSMSYSWPKIASSTYDLYQRLLGERTRME